MKKTKRTSPTTSVILNVRVLIDSAKQEEFEERLKKVMRDIMETTVDENTTRIKFVIPQEQEDKSDEQRPENLN